MQHIRTSASFKWFLTLDGYIRLHGFDSLVLGYQGENLVDGAAVVLTDYDESTHALRWKFSTPIFGKKKVTTVVEEKTSTSVIEEEQTLESIEDAPVAAAPETEHDTDTKYIAEGAAVAAAAGAAKAIEQVTVKKPEATAITSHVSEESKSTTPVAEKPAKTIDTVQERTQVALIVEGS